MWAEVRNHTIIFVSNLSPSLPQSRDGIKTFVSQKLTLSALWEYLKISFQNLHLFSSHCGEALTLTTLSHLWVKVTQDLWVNVTRDRSLGKLQQLEE